MIKKIGLGALVLLVAALLWYLFLKPGDYTVNFKIKTNTGTAMQSLKSWSSSLDSTRIVSQEGLEQLTQEIKKGDSLYRLQWYFKPQQDSILQVSVDVTDTNNSLDNRLAVPFGTTVVAQNAEEMVAAFGEALYDHLQHIKITIEGEATTPATYYAYVPEQGIQIEKALGMMANYTLLSDVLIQNQVELNGPPFVEITSWNIYNDSISYRFAFPVKRSDRLPDHPIIKYDRMNAKKSLKAVYNGNYITSDRAWYALLEYAKEQGIKVDARPIEIFYNNPNMGGNELNWKAEIFMPIATEED
ncbi:GyrI-like domain-containing protein [Croceiramulus getboli]|nr:GyrI-like domain-containing protein [Flavobacteriaceae bacterium YJPT1-3]